MLSFNELSFWEKSTFLENNDFVILGSGIVGLSTSIFLKKRYPNAKVLVLERGYLPTGASTKNAGFTCFGSPTELYDDFQKISENKVWETFQLRYEGLKLLFELIDKNSIDYENIGSWDLIRETNEKIPDDFLSYLNENSEKITGEKDIYQIDSGVANRFGFLNVKSAYWNRLEGSLNSGALIQALNKKSINLGVQSLFGVELLNFESSNNAVLLNTDKGEIKTINLIICTNGFVNKFYSGLLKPARAQVLITKPIRELRINGTFHLDRGYYYFRNVGNRILLGGGRNLDFLGETTEEINTTNQIQSKLEDLLRTTILPNDDFEVDYSWSGIMGVGDEKSPIIKKMNNNVAIGVRMGGMGVAIGAKVGEKLANLF